MTGWPKIAAVGVAVTIIVVEVWAGRVEAPHPRIMSAIVIRISKRVRPRQAVFLTAGGLTTIRLRTNPNHRHEVAVPVINLPLRLLCFSQFSEQAYT